MDRIVEREVSVKCFDGVEARIGAVGAGRECRHEASCHAPPCVPSARQRLDAGAISAAIELGQAGEARRGLLLGPAVGAIDQQQRIEEHARAHTGRPGALERNVPALE